MKVLKTAGPLPRWGWIGFALGFPPWAFLLQGLGVKAQVIGLFVQVIGLSVTLAGVVVRRK